MTNLKSIIKNTSKRIPFTLLLAFVYYLSMAQEDAHIHHLRTNQLISSSVSNASTATQTTANPYTLQNDDVDVIDGKITTLTYDFASKNIIIPDTLDGQAVTELDWGFEAQGIEKIQLPNTIKTIGEYTFYGNAIESIVIPDSMFEIGYASFNNNLISEVNGSPSDGLIYAKNIDGSNDSTRIVSYGGAAKIVDFIPSSAKTIGKYAFTENYLTELTIPNTITSIETAAFNWNTITTINGVAADGIIFDRNSNGSIDSTRIVSFCGTASIINFIPNTVTIIGEEAFYAGSLTEIDIPESTESIGALTFAYNSITSVSFASNGSLRYIGTNAFHGNTIGSITLPNSNIIDFSGWIDSYLNFYAAESSAITGNSYTANISYTLSDNDVVVQEGNIVSCSNTNGGTYITIPDTLDGQAVIGIRADVFSNLGIAAVNLPLHTNLTDFSGWLDYDNNAVSLSNGNYIINDLSITYIAKMPTYTLTSMDVVMNNNYIQSCSFSYGITAIIIPDTLDGQTVLGIGEEVFYKKGITSILLPSTLEYIGINALTYNEFSNITIPANVTTIDFKAFYGGWTDYNSNLSEVNFDAGSKLTTIGDKAFMECSQIKEFDLPDGIENIGDEAFNGCSLSNILIPQNTTYIGEKAFCGQGTTNTDLTSVTIENNSNLIIIGESAFADNDALTGFTLPTSSITDFLYWQCSALGVDKGNYLEGETTTVTTAQYTAQYPYTLTNSDVTMEEGYIKYYYIPSTISLNIIIPEILSSQTVKGISENGQSPAFRGRGFKSVTLPSTLEYISEFAFSDNSLSTIDIPDSVVHIGKYAFYNNSISSIVLPSHITTRFVGWIDNTDNLVELNSGHYLVSSWGLSYTAAYEVLFLDFNNDVLKTDTVKHYNSAVPPADPTHAGYTFTGWDLDYSNISQGMSVTAQYSLNGATNFTVSFIDWDGTVLSTQTVAEDSAAIAPENPVREAYTFTSWDTDFSAVSSDLTVNAQYTLNAPTADFSSDAVAGTAPFTVHFTDLSTGAEISSCSWSFGDGGTSIELEPAYTYNTPGTYSVNLTVINSSGTSTESKSDYIYVSAAPLPEYTVVFMDWDSTILSTQTIAEGNSATEPSTPIRKDYVFTSWDTDFSDVRENLTIKALYSPTSSINDSEDNAFRIYPNPTKNTLHVELTDYMLIQSQEKGIQIIDLTGSIVYQNTKLTAEQSIDISKLKDGLYFVKIANTVQKLIVR